MASAPTRYLQPDPYNYGTPSQIGKLTRPHLNLIVAVSIRGVEFMTRISKVSLWILALGLATQASATAIVNPLPPIPPGRTVGVQRFLTVPRLAQAGSSVLIQQIQPVRDGSNRLMINDTRGLLYVTDTRGSAAQPWFDIRSQGVGFSNSANTTQTGLMSFAFHPNFGRDAAKPGYDTFYTMDTSAPTGRASWAISGAPNNHENIVHEWTVADPHAASATIVSNREVLRVAQPYSDHGAGTIAFNPAAASGSTDYGKLYIGFGDGGAANDPFDSAQSLTSPFGKILRIDPVDPDGAGPRTYAIPAGNPFADQPDARPEVWAYGLRNPQNFSFDPSTGSMLISDIGQNQIEEVNVGLAGANYGWPLREGTFARGTSGSDFNIYATPANDGRFADPIAQYDHEEIFRDGHTLAGVGGAFLYAGTAIPELIGKVVLSDLVTGRLFYFSPDGAVNGAPAPLSELFLTLDALPTTMLALAGTSNSAGGRVDLRLGRDADGELYLLTKTRGEIFRLVGSVPEPATWAMLLLGFAMIGGMVRRRGAAATATA